MKNQYFLNSFFLKRKIDGQRISESISRIPLIRSLSLSTCNLIKRIVFSVETEILSSVDWDWFWAGFDFFLSALTRFWLFLCSGIQHLLNPIASWNRPLIASKSLAAVILQPLIFLINADRISLWSLCQMQITEYFLFDCFGLQTYLLAAKIII